MMDQAMRAVWRPTPQQFRAYLEREVELAIANIALDGSSLLSSTRTIDKARRRIEIRKEP